MSSNHTYKFYYSILVPMAYGQHTDQDMTITAQNPVRAIDIFHIQLQGQNARQDRATGNVIRPKLGPSDYKVTKFVLVYRDEVPPRNMIESEIDLPLSANPDASTKVKAELVIQSEMPLNDARQ